MRAILTAGAVVLMLGVVGAPNAAAHGSHGPLRWDGESWGSCRLPSGNDHEVMRLIRCAVDHYPTDLQTALYVAERESGYEPSAYNGTCCAGVYQQHLDYWPGRVIAYSHAASPDLDVQGSPYDARSNVLVSIWMAHHSGWGAWTTA